MEPLRDKNGRTEAEAIQIYRQKNYPKPALTADIAVFTRMGGKVKLLLIKRGGHPCLGQWALPGGFAESGETIETTAARELEEETGLTGLPLKLVGVYSAPGRDPRGWTVSVAYAVMGDAARLNAVAGDDAAEAQWFDIEQTPGGAVAVLDGSQKVAFDHAQIIRDAAAALRLDGK